MTEEKKKKPVEIPAEVRRGVYNTLKDALKIPAEIAKAICEVIDEKPRQVETKDGTREVVNFNPEAHPTDWVFQYWRRHKDRLKGSGMSIYKTDDKDTYHGPDVWRGAWWFEKGALPNEIVETTTNNPNATEPPATDWDTVVEEAANEPSVSDEDMPW